MDCRHCHVSVLFYRSGFLLIYLIHRGNDDRLAQINAVFRTIDLTTLTLAPLTAGLVFDLGSTRAAAHFLAAWNLVSVIFEYLLLKSIYHEYPQLSRKKIFEEKKEDYEEGKTKIDEESCNPFSRLVEAFQSWIMYMKYPIRNAGLGLACLYMTVLGGSTNQANLTRYKSTLNQDITTHYRYLKIVLLIVFQV